MSSLITECAFYNIVRQLDTCHVWATTKRKVSEDGEPFPFCTPCAKWVDDEKKREKVPR